MPMKKLAGASMATAAAMRFGVPAPANADTTTGVKARKAASAVKRSKSRDRGPMRSRARDVVRLPMPLDSRSENNPRAAAR